MSSEVRTTCPYCGVGCGVLAKALPDGSVSLRGDPDHPANFGRLCSKGSALAETLSLEGRLLYPEIDRRRVTWDAALDLVASRFSHTIAGHGPDSVAFYVSGQLLTEDYYVANKLMKGFVGSANIDTNSRLCMASAVAGHRRAFGADTVPGNYEDLELADLLVIVGSNLAWCHPVLYQRIAAERERRPSMRVVVVDPRRTATAEIADLHLPIRADGDVALFMGLLAHLADSGAVDRAYVEAHTSGFAEAVEAARRLTQGDLERSTGLDRAALDRFFRLFTWTPKTVTLFSQGVNQSASGTDKVNAIVNCHLATGRVGRPGASPFSVTGQPNAMGGREVGGLANMLAAHMQLDDEADRERVQRFWASPTIAERPGLKAVDLFRAVGDGRIKALWIMATNPVDSMPDADAVEAAIRACPFVVVSEVVAETDTIRHAHVRLPALGWGEKDGTVTNSERRISRQRAFLSAPGEAQADWRIVADVASRMGFGEAFDYASPAGVFAEHAALSAFENDGARDFDIGAWAAADERHYAAMTPFQWPLPAGQGSAESASRLFADGRFFTPDRKARFVAVAAPAASAVDSRFPLTLNTGRVRDHWHMMTRTGKSARLSQHIAEPFAEIHPADAARAGIAEAGIVRVSSSLGTVLLRAMISPRAQQGSIFAPMHWNDQFASRARIDALTAPVIDPYSGQPALKSTQAAIERFEASRYGFAVLQERPSTLDAAYWAIARCNDGWRIELAFGELRDWTAVAESLIGGSGEMLSLRDNTSGLERYARFDGERLIGAVYLADGPVEVSRDWAVGQLGAPHAGFAERMGVLAGRPGRGGADKGAIVCSCFSIGRKQIAEAATAGCTTVAAIGTALGAGTNCGSCRAEIKGIVDAHRLQAAE